MYSLRHGEESWCFPELHRAAFPSIKSGADLPTRGWFPHGPARAPHPEETDLDNLFSSAESAGKIVKPKAFYKFDNTSAALEAVNKLKDGALSDHLRKFLEGNCVGETLAVADSKLADVIKEELKIDCVHNDAVMELLGGVRSQQSELLSGFGEINLAPMTLGLPRSLARLELNPSSDKDDTQLIQAISGLDDIDKDLNTYAMRVRECYGRHFPELAKIIKDNILYAKSVKLMGDGINAAKLDFSEILAAEVEAELKEAAVISMGTEVTNPDLTHILELCDQVLSLSDYRDELYDYLKSRMKTRAPNLSALVGELVGARLIAESGGLWKLSQLPGSTIQILGAKKNTPHRGLIYETSLVSRATGQRRKKQMARSLAGKIALAVRCDVFREDKTVVVKCLESAEARLKEVEGKPETKKKRKFDAESSSYSAAEAKKAKNY